MGNLAITGGSKTLPDSEAVFDLNNVSFFGRKEIEVFEKAFAEYTRSKYALLLGSGTDALITALLAVGVEPGDEVLTVPITFPASVTSILNVNAIPVFVDVDPRTFTMNPEDAQRKITARTKAILPVDIYGHPAEILKLREIAQKHGLAVIEDGCQATGAQIAGEPLGGLADMTAFSFMGKPIWSSSGGVLTTNNDDFYERAWLVGQQPLFQNQKIKNPELRKYIATSGYGFNFRLDIHCLPQAFEGLEKLDERNDYRISNAEFLTRELESYAEILTTPYRVPECKHVYHLYTCLYNEEKTGIPRYKFVRALQAEGVVLTCYMTHLNYPQHGLYPTKECPLHQGSVFEDLELSSATRLYKGIPLQGRNYQRAVLPVAERIARQELSIPQYFLMQDRSLMEGYIEAFRKVLDNLEELRDVDCSEEYIFFR